jgi:hypothetical protein
LFIYCFAEVNSFRTKWFTWRLFLECPKLSHPYLYQADELPCKPGSFPVKTKKSIHIRKLIYTLLQVLTASALHVIFAISRQRVFKNATLSTSSEVISNE